MPEPAPAADPSPPDNATLAAWLAELADLLELEGENAFKVRAYRRAADVVAELPEPVSALVARRGLERIPTLGPSIWAQLEGAVATGRMDALEAARARSRVDVRTLRRLPGVGPRTLQRLHDELGVRTLEDLEEAMEAGRLRRHPDLGPALDARLRTAIPAVREGLRMRRLDEAFAVAERLAAHLPGARVLGDARRFVPLVDRLVLGVATLDDASEALRAIGAHDVETTSDAVTGLLGAFPVAIERVAPDDGKGIIQRTGPEGHVKNLMSWATGHKVSWQRLAGDEADVYAALGLAPVPPELREGLEEVELASVGGLTRIVGPGDIRGDLQCHTTFSDGATTILSMARAAAALGYEYLGVTDHAGALPIAGAMDEARIEAFVRAVGEANDAKPGVTVLAGVEAEVGREGALSVRDEALEQLDYVAAGIHVGLDLSPERQTERYVRAIKHPLVRLLVHPLGRKLNERPGARLDFDRVVGAAIGHRVALEVNASPVRCDLDAPRARRVLGRGGLLAINTDAHHPAELERMVFGLMQARKAYATPERVVNAWPLAKLREWMRGG